MEYQSKEEHDFVLTVHQESQKAYLLSSTGNRKDALWYPKSKIKIKQKMICKFAIPEWLAIQRGLFS